MSSCIRGPPTSHGTEDEWPYTATVAELGEFFTAKMRPYKDWANRGPTTMRVWMPVSSV